MAPSSSGESLWYLIHCKPYEDRRALENLERQGFECFLPLRKVEKRRNGRSYELQEPLFPRYLFIRLDSVNDNWYPIRSTRGVQQIVRFNQIPLPVPNRLIEQIRERLEVPTEPEPYLKPGERVQITEGAFAQMEAIFLTKEGKERVVLLLNILHRDQELAFPLHSVRKIASR